MNGARGPRSTGDAESAAGVRDHARRSNGSEQTATVAVLAIGRQGWAVAERRIEHATPLVVEAIAEQLRGMVRADSGWMPTIVVLDVTGDDVSARYRVE
jgi:hypothetical protein